MLATTICKKRLMFFAALCFFTLTAFSDEIVQIRFKTQADTPTVHTVPGEPNYVTVTFSSPTLTSIFSGYTFKSCYKSFPTISAFVHPLREPLTRVYDFVLVSGASTLLAALNGQVNVTISNKYFVPAIDTLHTPNDYNVDFSYATCPVTSPPGAPLKYLELIRARDAWDITKGDPDIHIGILDFQINQNHLDLEGKFVGTGFCTGSVNGHGTSVAGYAAANTNNGIGISSIGYNCKLRAYCASYNSMLQAAKDGVKVINCSWTTGCCYNQNEQDIINVVTDVGVTVIAAAGNGLSYGTQFCSDGSTINCAGSDVKLYPASYGNVISVTSVGHAFSRTLGIPEPCYGFTYHEDVHDVNAPAWGVTVEHQHNDKVDISSFGYGVRGILAGGYGNRTGTSFAAPIVSGAAGLIYSLKSTFQPEEIEGILKCSSVGLYSIPQNSPFVGKLGSGRLDAYNALLKAQDLISKRPIDIIWSYDDASTGRRVRCDPIEVGLLLANNQMLNNTLYCEALPSSLTPSVSSFRWLIKSTGWGNIIRKTGNSISIQLPNDFGTQGASCFLSVNARNEAPSFCDVNASSYYGEVADIAPPGMICPNIPPPLGSRNTLAAVAEIKNTENTEKLIVAISPNPANHQVNIKLGHQNGSPINISLKDVNGNVLIQKLVTTNNINLNMDRYPKGVYFVQVMHRGNSQTKKIILQ